MTATFVSLTGLESLVELVHDSRRARRTKLVTVFVSRSASYKGTTATIIPPQTSASLRPLTLCVVDPGTVTTSPPPHLCRLPRSALTRPQHRSHGIRRRATAQVLGQGLPQRRDDPPVPNVPEARKGVVLLLARLLQEELGNSQHRACELSKRANRLLRMTTKPSTRLRAQAQVTLSARSSLRK